MKQPREILEIPFSSNSVRLTAREWIPVLVVVAGFFVCAPILARRAAQEELPADYRVPFALGYDYWMFGRECNLLADRQVIPVIGDSVVWGHYVVSENSLSSCLNRECGRPVFANLSVDGAHPAALSGLVRFYGSAIRDKAVILHCNPLWMTSIKQDLRTKKERAFNHPDLVPQFRPWIPCYRKKFKDRFAIAVKRGVPLFAWADHLRISRFDSLDLYNWSVEHPYRCPGCALLSGSLPDYRPVPPDTVPAPWMESDKYGVVNPGWVKVAESLQWRLFLDTVDVLERRGNRVFVLVGPYNRHMLTETSAQTYDNLSADMDRELAAANIPHWVPAALPSALYADSSHPLAGGYAELARRLLNAAPFREFVDKEPAFGEMGDAQ